jgi:hypothetical protein
MTLTCTIGPNAVTGARCGAPAIISFVARDGRTYHECADHHVFLDPDAVKVGDSFPVRHCGVDKIGTVVRVTATRVVVDVPTYGGRRTARITAPRTDTGRPR